MYRFEYPGSANNPHRDFFHLVWKPCICRQPYCLSPIVFKYRSNLHGTLLVAIYMKCIANRNLHHHTTQQSPHNTLQGLRQESIILLV